MKVALTGATGFLGERALEALLARGHEVRALARERAGRVLPERAGVEWVRGDLGDESAPRDLVAGADAVVHAAYTDDAAEFVRANVSGTLRLLEQAAARGVPFVFASSLAVYGRDPDADPLGERLRRHEDFPLWPTEVYGAHKAALEKLVFAAGASLGLRATVLRLGWVVGAREPWEENAFASVVDEALAHGELRTPAGGYVIDVDDAAALLVDAVEDERYGGKVLNAFDRWLDFADTAPLLAELLGRPVGVACPASRPPRTPIENGRLRALGYRPRMDGWPRALLGELVARRRSAAGSSAPLDLARGPSRPMDGAALARAREIGERLRAAFSEACAREDVRARLAGPAEDMAFVFEGQENATREQLVARFVLELRERELAGGRLRPDPAWSDADVERAREGLDANVRRMRGLLIEHNSYFSDGVPWVFPPTVPPIQERGLARYRFPKDGPVDLEVEDAALRIRFAPGSLGAITSSGFYAPTPIEGDFRVELRYRLERWRPGDDAACFALYVHDEAALERHYAQRSSAREDGERHHLMANFADRPTERVPVAGPRGAFRIERRGARLACLHRAEGETAWLLLGEHETRGTPPMITGAKAWAKIDSDGLDVVLEEWRIEPLA